MKLSVIMPVHNREWLVGAALRSLLRQKHEVDLDIIVVDDGSVDHTREAVARLAEEASCIRLFAQPNCGVAAARNAGLRMLPPDTEFVSFLDSDDVSPAGRFRADLWHFAAEPDLELVYSMVASVGSFDESGVEPLETDGAPSRRIQLGAAIFRRRLIDSAGFFDEGFVQAEDTDFLFRVFERKPRCKYLDTVGVYCRRHAESLTTRKDVVRREYLRAYHKAARRKAQQAADVIPREMAEPDAL